MIGAFLGVGAIPFYAVANSLVVYLMDFVIAIAAVVSPMATKLNTERKLDELREVFLRWSKVALSLTIMVGLFLIVLGPRASSAGGSSPDFERPSGQVLQILMVSSFAFLPVRGVALPVLMGLGRPRAAMIAFVAAGVANFVLERACWRDPSAPCRCGAGNSDPQRPLRGLCPGDRVPGAAGQHTDVSAVCRSARVSLAHSQSWRCSCGSVSACRSATIVGLAAAGTAKMICYSA